MNAESTGFAFPPVHVNAGGYEVLYSGSAILPDDNLYIEFTLAGIKIRIEFVDDPEVKERQTTISALSDHDILIKCISWANGQEIGLSEPVDLMTINGVMIYMKFIISDFKNLNLISYSFYRRLGEQDGK